MQHWSGLFGHSWIGGIQPALHRAQPGLPVPAQRQRAKGNPLGGPFPEQDCISLPPYDLDWKYLFSPVPFFAPKAFLNSFCKITGEHRCKNKSTRSDINVFLLKFFGWSLFTLSCILNGVEWKYFFSCVSGFPHDNKIPGLKKILIMWEKKTLVNIFLNKICWNIYKFPKNLFSIIPLSVSKTPK